MNGSCSMHVRYMNCINILLLRPEWKGRPENHVHGLVVKVCTMGSYRGSGGIAPPVVNVSVDGDGW